MNIILYLGIFIFKIIENCLSTVRLILVSNGNKKAGAILIFFISLIWIISTSITIINITEDPFKVFVFALGSLVGSYLGSIIEELLAIGNILVICITEKKITTFLRDTGYIVTTLDGDGLKSNKEVLLIAISRKEKDKLVKKIIELDSSSMIITNCIY